MHHPLASPLGKIFLLGLAYFIAGRLALLLAIPPGFATAIFPPLGISLAAVLLWGNRLLPGVFLGSFCLNASIALGNGAELNMATMMVACEIAAGSSLATWVGASCIRRTIGFPNDLADEWSIFRFFILGGPFACILSASIGVGALWFNHVITAEGFIFSWLTWWTGDAIGVLLGAPVVLIFYGQPRQLWRGRAVSVGLPLLLSFGLMVAIFFYTSFIEQQKIQGAFRNSAEDIGSEIFREFDQQIQLLIPLKGLYLASDEVTRDDFRLFSEGLLGTQDGVWALSWDQLVTQKQRQEFEQKIKNAGYEDFQIHELDTSNHLVPAGQRNTYVVVTYIEPFLKNSFAHGLDVASDVARRHALDLAGVTGNPVMTEPLQVVQDQSAGMSYLVFMPVYETADTPQTPELRKQLLRGYVTALFSVNSELKKIHKEFSAELFNITLTDRSSAEKPNILYQDSHAQLTPFMQRFIYQTSRVVAGREIDIKIWPTEKFIYNNRGMQSWYVLVGGLLFCSMLGGFLLLVTGRTRLVSLLVEQRTLELESIVNATVEAIIIFDEFGRVERVNPAACTLFNVKHENLIGVRSDSLVPVLNDLKTMKNTGVVEPVSKTVWKSLETFAVNVHGAHIPVEIGVSSVELPDRRIYTCIIHDVTARKKIDRLKSEFISTVSHELRTPLTSISGALGLLIGGAVPHIPSKALDLLIIAKNNASRLGRLVNDILDIEKLEFGALQMELESQDVNELLAAAIEQNAGYAVKYGVHLALDNQGVVGRDLIIRVDADRFLQVMSNLISNAIKYSNLGGIVTISANVDEDFVTFRVEDHGAGIPEDFRDRIFQKFAQADSSDTRRREGTGLGLSISRIIVERMGGVIKYTSEINKGSVFYFSLPLVKQQLH